MTEHNLSEKKIGELRELAKTLDISSPYKYKKDELIDIILQSYASLEKEKENEISTEGEITIALKDIEMRISAGKSPMNWKIWNNKWCRRSRLHSDGYGFLRIR